MSTPHTKKRDYSRGRIGLHESYYGKRAGSRGFSSCMRCQTSWAFVHGHTTNYDGVRGCFPLCEECWGELSPEDRLPFYRVLWEQWAAGFRLGTYGGYDDSKRETELRRLEADWPLIRAAVLGGD